MAHFNFVIIQNAKWVHAGFYIDRHDYWVGLIDVYKLTTDVVTYCTEASNQKSKYAYRKIFFYKKTLHISRNFAHFMYTVTETNNLECACSV